MFKIAKPPMSQSSAQHQQQQQQQRTPKTTPLVDDYEISNTVLGLGINGKVVECTNRKTNQKYALKVRIMLGITYSIYYVRSFFKNIHHFQKEFKSRKTETLVENMKKKLYAFF